MKKFFCLGLALAAASLFSTPCFARGGHAGGEREEGRGRSEESRPRGEQQHETNRNVEERRTADVGEHTEAARHETQAIHTAPGNRVSQLKTNHAPSNPPFTPAWHAAHPNAWQGANSHADAWAAASLGAAGAWLGLAATDDVADDATDGDNQGVAATVLPDNSVASTDSDNSDDNSADESNEQSTSDAAAAAHLAQAGSAKANADGDFLPLGVFAVAPDGQEEATAMLQISVSHEGIIRGSYYDLMGDQGQAIQGAVDKKTQRVAFTVGPKGKTIFETQLADLTSPTGEVSLHFPDGQASDWGMSRFEDTDPKSQVE